MVQVGPLRERLPRVARALIRSARASPLGAAQLVGSQLFVGSFENLTLFQCFHFWGNLVPVLNYSQAEEISAHVQSSMSHSNVQWVSSCPGWPYAVSCHLKPCLWGHLCAEGFYGPCTYQLDVSFLPGKAGLAPGVCSHRMCWLALTLVSLLSVALSPGTSAPGCHALICSGSVSSLIWPRGSSGSLSGFDIWLWSSQCCPLFSKLLLWVGQEEGAEPLPEEMEYPSMEQLGEQVRIKGCVQWKTKRFIKNGFVEKWSLTVAIDILFLFETRSFGVKIVFPFPLRYRIG